MSKSNASHALMSSSHFSTSQLCYRVRNCFEELLQVAFACKACAIIDLPTDAALISVIHINQEFRDNFSCLIGECCIE